MTILDVMCVIHQYQRAMIRNEIENYERYLTKFEIAARYVTLYVRDAERKTVIGRTSVIFAKNFKLCYA